MSSKRLICSKYSKHVARRSRSRSRPSVDVLFLNHRHHQLRNMTIKTSNRVSRTGRDMNKEGLEQGGIRHGGTVGKILDGSKFAAFCHVQQRMNH